MTLLYEERLSDSSVVETITYGRTVSDGETVRPAEIHWHMVLVRYEDNVHPLIVGPWTSAGNVSWMEGAEILWIKFKAGTFMPHLPTNKFLNSETRLPEAGSRSFWLNGSAWQFPDFGNVDTFVDRLVHQDVLVRDTVVSAALQNQVPDVSERTVRDRFLRATGQTRSHIRQFERALQASALLEQGVPILDVVYQLNYFDQPHLTRSLKRFTGKTPAQHLPTCCHSVESSSPKLLELMM